MPTIVIVTGTIDSDVNVKTFPATAEKKAGKLASFRVNDGKGWTSVDAWNEIADKVPAKGAFVIVQGRLSTRSYDKDGVKTYTTSVVASSIDAIGGAAPDDLFD